MALTAGRRRAAAAAAALAGVCALAASCHSAAHLNNADLAGSALFVTPANAPLSLAAAGARVRVRLASGQHAAWTGYQVSLAAPHCQVTPAAATTDARGLADFQVSCDQPRFVPLSAQLALDGLSLAVPATASLNVYTPSDGQQAVPPGSRLNLQAVAPMAGDANQVDPTFVGRLHFVSSDPLAQLPADTTMAAADAGVRTFVAALAFFTAGAQRVEVICPDDGRVLAAQRFVVSRGESMARFAAAGYTATAGVPLAVDIFGVHQDGSLDPGFAHQIGWESSDAAATLPPPIAFRAADQGRRQLTSGPLMRTAGAQTLALIDQQTGQVSQVPVQVLPAAASTLEMSFGDLQVAGQPFDLTVAARDAFGNLDVGFADDLQLASNDPAATLASGLAVGEADGGRRTFPGAATLRRADGSPLQLSVVALGRSVSGVRTVALAPAATAILRLQLSAQAVAGAPQDLQLRAEDAFGNLTPAYRATIQVAASQPRTVVPGALTMGAAQAGALVLPRALAFLDAGLQTVSASDLQSPALSAQTTVQVAPAGVAALSVGLGASLAAGQPTDLQLRALDPFGNLVPGFVGRVVLSHDDPAGSLAPAQVDLGAADAGGRLLPGALVLRTTGPHQVVAASALPPVRTTTAVAVTAGPPRRLLIDQLPAAAVRTQPLSPRLRVVDALGNLCPAARGTVALTATPAAGVTLPASVTFGAAEAGNVTLAHQLAVDPVGPVQLQATPSDPSWQAASAAVNITHGCFRYGDVTPVAGFDLSAYVEYHLSLDASDRPTVVHHTRHFPGSQRGIYVEAVEAVGFAAAGWTRFGPDPTLLANSFIPSTGRTASDSQQRVVVALNNGSGQNFVRRFADGAWQGLDNSYATSVFTANDTDIAIDPSDRPWLAGAVTVAGGADVALAYFDGSHWGAPGGTARLQMPGQNYHPKLVVDALGVPTVTFSGTSSGNAEIYVASGQNVLSGGIWAGPAGGALVDNISQNSGSSVRPSICLDQQQRPVVAWSDDQSGVSQIYLRRFDGTAWVELAGSASDDGISELPGGAFSAAVGVDSRNWPVVAFVSTLTGAVMMRRYNGSVWVEEYGSASGAGMAQSCSPFPITMRVASDDRPVFVYPDPLGINVCSWR